MINDYIKPFLRGANSVLRVFSMGVFIIAVFVTVIALFIRVGSKEFKTGPTIQQKIEAKRQILYKQAHELDKNKAPIARFASRSIGRAMCSFNGELCNSNPKSSENDFTKSFMGQTGLVVLAPIMSPPASFTYYVYDGLNHIGFIPKAVASEGVGFAGIQPLASTWRVFRNIAYFVLVVILIAVGFMIMFRMKLNPQTVISIENALPRIVLALLFITFSFPIAGFLIDLMYVIMAVLILAIGPLAGIPANEIFSKFVNSTPSAIPSLILGKGIWGIPGFGDVSGMWRAFITLPENLMRVFGWGFYTIWQLIGATLGVLYLFPFLKHLFYEGIADAGDVNVESSLFGIGTSEDGQFRALTGIGWLGILFLASLVIGPLLLRLLLGVIIFFSVVTLSFRIFFMLLSSYIKIISLVILSPMILMFEALPGKATFTNWLRTLFAELLTFPILIAVFIVGSVIIDTASGANLIRLPFLNNVTAFGVPTGVGLNTSSLVLLMGFTILFMTPDLVLFFRKMVSPKGLNLPTGGLGVFFGGGVAAVDTGLTKVGSYSHAFTGISHLSKSSLVKRFLPKLAGGKSGGGGDGHPS